MMCADIRLGRWEDVLAGETCDALIVDAPYSAKTHSGHDGAAAAPTEKSATWACANGRVVKKINRRSITYSAWSPDDVAAFVESWAPRTRGWIVSITDDVLAPAWASAMEAAGRYVFAPLPLVETGSRVRLSGDGPSAWTCWVIVSRPKTRDFQRWGTLRGAYIAGSERKDVVGGKPLGLMRQIVEDYSRPGDVVCDPCCGAGTTLAAACLEGRRAIGAEMDPVHYEIARERTAKMPVGTATQPALFDAMDGLGEGVRL